MVLGTIRAVLRLRSLLRFRSRKRLLSPLRCLSLLGSMSRHQGVLQDMVAILGPRIEFIKRLGMTVVMLNFSSGTKSILR